MNLWITFAIWLASLVCTAKVFYDVGYRRRQIDEMRHRGKR